MLYCVCVCVCMCVCVCVRARVCVCVCVCDGYTIVNRLGWENSQFHRLISNYNSFLVK